MAVLANARITKRKNPMVIRVLRKLCHCRPSFGVNMKAPTDQCFVVLLPHRPGAY